MAKNQKREAKMARKERARAAREEKQAAAAETQRRLALRRRISVGIGVVTVVAAAVCYWGLENRQLTGVALLVGGIVFLLHAMGTLGASVRPRDRGRAGSIDFGKRD